jgi:hypothetical protein
MTLLTIRHFSHADTDIFYHDTFQTCGHWRFLSQHIPAMLTLTSLTTKHSSHSYNGHLGPPHIPAILKPTFLTATHSRRFLPQPIPAVLKRISLVKDIRYRMSNIGYWILDIGYWISDIGYRISDIGYPWSKISGYL